MSKNEHSLRVCGSLSTELWRRAWLNRLKCYLTHLINIDSYQGFVAIASTESLVTKPANKISWNQANLHVHLHNLSSQEIFSGSASLLRTLMLSSMVDFSPEVVGVFNNVCEQSSDKPLRKRSGLLTYWEKCLLTLKRTDDSCRIICFDCL